MSGRDVIEPLVSDPGANTPRASNVGRSGVVIGELLALVDEGGTPLVRDPTQPQAPAMRAISVVDVCEMHVGMPVVLAFQAGDPTPIILGVIASHLGSPGVEQPKNVVVETDGHRMLVAAKRQLVLRCGRASITLTSAGKVLIQGEYVSSNATGLNRIRGGAIELN